MKSSNMLVLALAASAALALGQTQKVGWSTGYYAGWAEGNYPASKINWKAYTHMCHFSATPTASGGVNLSMGISDASAKLFVAEAHKNKVKAILCVGGAGTGSQFQSASGNDATRATLVKNMIGLMQKYGYDGLDLDWEEIGGKEAGYQKLSKDLRAAIDLITPKPLLTVAMANYIIDAFGPVYAVFDQMNNMCYWTHASGLTNDFKDIVAKGVPVAKMGVGIGFDYEENGHPEVDCDPTSVKQKCDWALANKYGGVMVWAIEQDFKRYKGQEPSHAALLPYVPDPSVSLAGPNFGLAAQEMFTMTISNGSMGKPLIRYQIPSAAELSGAVVDLGLYSTDGRMVKTLMHGRSRPGAYTLSLDQNTAAIRPGAYVVKLSAGSESRAAQTLILK